MSNLDWALKAQAKAHAKREYDKEVVAGRGSAPAGLETCGPPYWNREAWEQFRALNGFYPFGWQEGTRIIPPTFQGAPDWVYELMDMRKPPVMVTPGQDNSR